MMDRKIKALREELDSLCKRVGREIRIMEVCGTHTVSIFRTGIRSILPSNLRLISGPGCPVCVTAQRHIDAAIDIADRDGVIVATYGDMLRVPGQRGSLQQLRASGARIQVINSARSALDLARENPDRQVVFLAVGFETTAPATAATVLEADQAGIENFSVLMCHKLVMPAMTTLLETGDVPLDGFLCPGHVSVIIGSDAYQPLVERFGKACVVAGFEPAQIFAGLVYLLRQFIENRVVVENVYPAVVGRHGNPVALELFERVFVVADAPWRALGIIPGSGQELAPAYERFDALKRFEIELGEDQDHPNCRCGEVIQGKVEPAECQLFAKACTPLSPIGPCMVSSEGTCSAWYKYNRTVTNG